MIFESILTQIFNHQQESINLNGKCDQINAKLENNEKILTDALKNDEKLLKSYKAAMDAQEEYEAIAVKDFYTLGFKSGFKLAMEIFNINIDYFAD
ncbi:MAG: hypothetical protein K2J16_07250 [Clostridia bacterium]|nr:hypothetical protein [Clostridia bacterium]